MESPRSERECPCWITNSKWRATVSTPSCIAGDAAPLLDLLSPEGFTIDLIEEKQTISTIAGVQAWFAKFPMIIEQNNHIVESIEVSRNASQAGPAKWRAVTRIRCPVITVQGQSAVVTSHHDWEVIDYGGALPRICRMKIKLVRGA